VTRVASRRGLPDALLAVIPDPVAVLDQGGRVLLLGPAAEQKLGWSAEEMAGRRLADLLVAEEDRHRLPQRLLGDHNGIRGAESRAGVPCRRRDGSVFTAEVIVADVDDGQGPKLVAVVRPDHAEEAHDLFQLVFRSAPDIISIIDRERGQLLVNDAAERLLGHTLRRIEDNVAIVHPDDRRRVQRDLSPPDGGFGGPVRYRARTASGEWRWLESNSADLRRVPPVSGILVFTRDVTAEVLATERVAVAAARMAALVTSLPAGILMVDEEGHVVAANAALCGMFGLDGPPDALVGRPLDEVVDELSARFQEAAAFRDWSREPTAGRASRTRVWSLPDGRTVELEATPIQDDRGDLGRLWAFRDVSDRAAAEAQRERMMRLEQDARRSAEQQSERLRELDRMRQQLIATVSHELRTPLTPIASHVELLLDGYPDPLTPEQGRMVEVIRRNVERLRRLVDDLLTVRRAEQGLLEIHPARVDLPALVAAQAEQFRPYAERLGVTLSCEATPGPPVTGDADRLGTVVDNLLANALKFTPSGGRIDVVATIEGRAWRIQVTDTGHGIAPGDIDRVFDPFFRTESAVHEGLPGSGLGLAVARALVEGHGGDISVTSVPGRGSSFVVRLPASGALT
jgi:PAS domain S-box-containing protein